jgi:hypothetical protein
VGSLYPSEKALFELRAIMDETGSRERLQAVGGEPHPRA